MLVPVSFCGNSSWKVNGGDFLRSRSEFLICPVYVSVFLDYSDRERVAVGDSTSLLQSHGN